MRARQSSQSIAARSSSANFALAQPVRTARDPGLSDTAWSRSPPRRPWPGRARAQPAHSHTALRCAPGDGRPHGPAWPAARRPKGPRRSPGALAHSHTVTHGARRRCPAPAPPAVPCPRSPRRSPTGGALAASDGLVGFVCPTEFWGHVTREIFKIRPKSQL